MAFNRTTRSSAPMFVTNPGILDEDNPAASDGLSPHPGANRWLGAEALHHDGELNLAPNANRVSDASLRSRAALDGVGRPTAGRPDGVETSTGRTIPLLDQVRRSR